MRICVSVQRPPHVHFFRHAIRDLRADGHEVHLFARDTEVTTALLDAYGLEYTLLAGDASSLPAVAATQIAFEARLLAHCRRLDPDVITSIGGVSASHVASAIGAHSVVFTDTEHATLSNRLMSPFADDILTPDCFVTEFGPGHVRYPGYHELAYLHPNRFEPDPSVRDDVGIDADAPIVVLRHTAWDAAHDVGANGLDDLRDVVFRLEDAGARVVLTAETSFPRELDDRVTDVPPERMHDLLAEAALYVGEGATMAAESAVLGTPSIYVNTLRMGYTDELDARYDLLYNFQGAYRQRNAVRTAEAILNGDIDVDWADRRERLLADKTDTTEVIVDALLAAG